MILPSLAFSVYGPVYSLLFSVYFSVTEREAEFSVKRHMHAHEYAATCKVALQLLHIVYVKHNCLTFNLDVTSLLVRERAT